MEDSPVKYFYLCTIVHGRKKLSFTAGTQMLCIEVGQVFFFFLLSGYY